MKKKGMGDHDVNNRYVHHGALWEFHCVTTMAETWPESISLIPVADPGGGVQGVQGVQGVRTPFWATM